MNESKVKFLYKTKINILTKNDLHISIKMEDIKQLDLITKLLNSYEKKKFDEILDKFGFLYAIAELAYDLRRYDTGGELYNIGRDYEGEKDWEKFLSGVGPELLEIYNKRNYYYSYDGYYKFNA